MQRNPYIDPPLPNVFNPEDEKVISQTIHDLCDDSMTLNDVAHVHNTSLPALTAWMARPDISERIDNLFHAMQRRARLVAANSLVTSVTALKQLVVNHLNDEAHAHTANPYTAELRARKAESARKAAALLTRIGLTPLHAGREVGTPSTRTGTPTVREEHGRAAAVQRPRPTPQPALPAATRNLSTASHRRPLRGRAPAPTGTYPPPPAHFGTTDEVVLFTTHKAHWPPRRVQQPRSQTSTPAQSTPPTTKASLGLNPSRAPPTPSMPG